MTTFAPKTYQQQVLDSVEAYFKACHELPSPSIAFTATTERLWDRGLPYNPLLGFPKDMPYFCLRVPTGGGKTWLAAKSVARVNTHLLRCEHSVILWLVPSKPTRQQTLKALKDRQHPYCNALREAGPVTVLDLEEAKSVTRATLDTSTTLIVATLPVVLETEPNWQQCLADAIGRRDALHKLADEERQSGEPYLRPIVLIQAEPRRPGVETLDFARVRNELIANHGIPANEIVVATGEEKGLEQIDADYKLGIADPACPVKFVITQKALAEGWDCPFAYILVSMAALHSATTIEQLLGRVLRQPGAKHAQARALN